MLHQSQEEASFISLTDLFDVSELGPYRELLLEVHIVKLGLILSFYHFNLVKHFIEEEKQVWGRLLCFFFDTMDVFL